MGLKEEVRKIIEVYNHHEDIGIATEAILSLIARHNAPIVGEIKRYDFEYSPQLKGIPVRPTDDGQWVSYEDHLKVLAKETEGKDKKLAKECEISSKVAAVWEKENQRLKDEVERLHQRLDNFHNGGEK